MNQSQKLIVITLMTPQGETGVQTHFNAIIHEAEKRGIETQLIHPYDSSVRVARKAVGLVAKLLKILNKEWFILWTRWTHYFLIRYLLRQSLRDEEKNISIYAQDPLSARAALAERKPFHRVVTTVHFNISESHEVLTKGLTVEGGPLYRHLQDNEAHTLPLVDKIIFVSAFMQGQVNARLRTIKSVPQTVLANFIEDSREQKTESKIHGDLITIGTLEKRKNQAFILKVLANAHSRGHRYRLTVIGDGPDRASLEQLAAELNLGSSITFLGFQANAVQYMPGHRIYVQASLMESFGITLIEALSHSLPILAPAVGGIPDILVDGEQGYFWPLDNVDIAANKLCEVLENEVLYAQLSSQARARFETHFSEQALAHSWLTALLNA